MTKSDKEPTELEMDFGEALRRFIQTNPKEIADLAEEARRKGDNIERYVKERVDSIRRGARRAPKRFRL